MQQAVGSFFQYLAGFLFFISLSFGLTYVVSTYSNARTAQQAAAAATALMLQQKQF